MRKYATIIAFTILFFMLIQPSLFSQDLSKSVVKIHVTTVEYDYYAPWQLKGHSSFTLQGCVIDSAKGQIITLSHPLLNCVNIEVSKLGDVRRYPASITLSDYTIGLAIVTVEDKAFFKDLIQVKLFDKKTKLAGASIVKWDKQEIFKSYSCDPLKTAIQSYEDFGVALFHEMTTVLDSGGDGEPVFLGGKLIGLVGWFDPAKKTVKVNSFETISWLLRAYAKSKYLGQPFFSIKASFLKGDENYKTYMGLARSDTGIAVDHVAVSSSGYGILKPLDVIVNIDGQKIDDLGYVETPEYGKLSFLWTIGLKHFVGDSLKITVVREKKKQVLTFPLIASDADSFLVPPEYLDTPPKYYIAGGLLFQELSKPYMEIWGDDWQKKGDKRMLHIISSDWADPKKNTKRVVILNRVLPSNYNIGYINENNLVLESIGGVQVRDIRHLKELIEKSANEYLVFEFTGNEKIVFLRKNIESANQDVLKRYGISRTHNIE
jgi:hypothetical protein